MCIINDITHFVKNGFTVLRHASSGNYEENSPEIEALKREMFFKPSNRLQILSAQYGCQQSLRWIYLCL